MTNARTAAKKSATKKTAATRSRAGGTAAERISRYIAGIADWRGRTLAGIRRAFHQADPAIVEEWKWMGSPVWSCHGLIAVANAHRDKVKLTFSRGAHLPDPHELFNAGRGGSQWRAIDFHEGDEIDAASLKDLIRAAIGHNLSRSQASPGRSPRSPVAAPGASRPRTRKR